MARRRRRATPLAPRSTPMESHKPFLNPARRAVSDVPGVTNSGHVDQSHMAGGGRCLGGAWRPGPLTDPMRALIPRPLRRDIACQRAPRAKLSGVARLMVSPDKSLARDRRTQCRSSARTGPCRKQASLVGDQTASSERIKPMARSMAVQARWPRIYRMLKAAGHDPAEAAEILRAAERKGDSALALRRCAPRPRPLIFEGDHETRA
jgi:hypothetical protein